MGTLEHLQRVALNIALVVFYPTESLRVGTPSKGAVEGKFLFVDPIWQSVDDLVELSIGSNLLLLLSVGDEDIVLSDECNLLSVRRESGNLLGTALRQLAQGLVFYIIYVEIGSERAPVYALVVCLNEHVLAVSSNLIIVETLDSLSFSVLDIKQGPHLFAGAEGESNDFFPVG